MVVCAWRSKTVTQTFSYDTTNYWNLTDVLPTILLTEQLAYRLLLAGWGPRESFVNYLKRGRVLKRKRCNEQNYLFSSAWFQRDSRVDNCSRHAWTDDRHSFGNILRSSSSVQKASRFGLFGTLLSLLAGASSRGLVPGIGFSKMTNINI